MNVKLPKPTSQQVNYYIEKGKSLDNYVQQEKALNKLFDLMPNNHDVSEVLLKCSTLNDFYSTNIFSVYSVAKHILTIQKFDLRLKNGDLSLVNELQNVTISGVEKHFYSFATKYCSHHNPEMFPIYDSYVDKVLWEFNKEHSFSKFKRTDLKNYIEFKRVLVDFKNYFKLNEFTIKELDQYLWLLGKEKFSKTKSE
ncbi:hypothetical protein [Rodentibacter heidelbergensis]|uniref:30S ribosomal protein S15 n=1 Tax=Rodentibacter heidelbergensis TaxID=1908258 RepID=A0A1V3I9E6_9PAST|nr:hypothetical protein [Rodentibacter heidelbergensis]OOF36386.1 hypothetical protein BKK48_06465 [Rodentibacter heidelbergensis]